MISYHQQNGHTDFIFDITWLDDHFLVSGSRDSNIVIWKVDDSNCEIDPATNLYKMNYLTPVDKFSYFDINKIRCLNFNMRNKVSCRLMMIIKKCAFNICFMFSNNRRSPPCRSMQSYI